MRFPALHLGYGTVHGEVTVFPVWAEDPVVRGVSPALRLEIGEVGAGGQVGRVQLTNPLPSSCLVLDGEVVEGGQQHRALARTVVLGARSSHAAEIVCVELGRWSGGGAFVRRGLRTLTRLRAGLRESAGVRQQVVWDRVAELGRRRGVASPTGSFVDVVRGPADADNRPVTALAGQRGVLLGVDGQPLSLDLFGSTTLLRAHLPGLVAAARLDALGSERVPARRALRMLTHLDGLALDPSGDDVGHAKSVCAETTHAALHAVLVGSAKAPAHLSVFNTRHPVLEVA